MDLKDKKCEPCSSSVPTLALDKKHQLLASLSSEWKLEAQDTRIQRSYEFKNFKMALAFVNEVGRIAEEENHHPEIHLGWGHCDVEIWTHANNDLSENDFILAAKIEAAYSET